MTTDPHAHWNTTYKTRGIVAVIEFAKKASAHLKANTSILDIGCGDGRDAAYFATLGHHVTAIDFSEEAIERVQKLNSTIDARVMNTTNIDFPDTSFDAVYAHLSLHYFDDATTEAIFQNIRRMLKPNGLFFVRCKSTKDVFFGEGERVGENMFLRGHLRHFFTPDYMRKQLKDFEVLLLEETTAEYNGRISAFVEAVARK